MLKPIPYKILSQNGIIKVPNGVDKWQNPTYTECEINHIHLQNTNEVRKSKDNTEVVLTSVLFIDARLSTPRYDLTNMADTAQANGSDLKITIDGIEYTVQTVDALPDDEGKLHHWELGLI